MTATPIDLHASRIWITDEYEFDISGVGVRCNFRFVREGDRLADLEVHDITDAWLGGPQIDDAIAIGDDEWSELFPFRAHLSDWNVPLDVSRATHQSAALTDAIRQRIESTDYAIAQVCERESM